MNEDIPEHLASKHLWRAVQHIQTAYRMLEDILPPENPDCSELQRIERELMIYRSRYNHLPKRSTT